MHAFRALPIENGINFAVLFSGWGLLLVVGAGVAHRDWLSCGLFIWDLPLLHL